MLRIPFRPHANVSAIIFLFNVISLRYQFYTYVYVSTTRLTYYLLPSDMAYAIPFLATWLLLAQLAVSQTDSSTECSCFLTNGSSSGYFNSHNFYDYRNVPDVSPTIPPVIGDLIDTTNAPETSDFFTSDEFQSQWEIQNWNNSNQFVSPSATVGLANSLNNVYIGKIIFTSLTLETSSNRSCLLQKPLSITHPIIVHTLHSEPPVSPTSNPLPSSTAQHKTTTTSLCVSSRVWSAHPVPAQECSPIYHP